MARRFWSALVVLCFVVVGLVAQSPSSHATTPPPAWPAKVATTWDAVVTANQTNGGAYVASCGNTIGKDQLTRLGANGEQYPILANSSVMGAACAPDLLLDDGTMLINRYPTASTSELSAWKNGRQLWALDTSWSTNCSVSSGASYVANASGVALSPDGETLYTIFTGGASGSSCVDHVVGLDRTNGTVEMFFPLASGSQPTTLATPKVWTYADKLVVLDRTQTIRELSYAGTENTSAAYQFPDAWLTPAAHSVADTFGTVFVTGNQGGAWYDNKLRWHTADDESGTVSYSLGYAPAQIVSDGMGSVYFLDAQAQKVKTLNLDTETLDEHPLALHTGAGPVAYTQDTEGNGLVVQTYMDSTTGERVTDISVIDGGTNTATSQADFRQDTNDISLPNAYEYATGNLATMVAGDYLYYPFCEAQNIACYSATGVELVVQQIELSGFGAPARSDNTRTAVEDDRLEYVALGDSFSSGEGVEPFLPGTDRDDITATSGVNEENRCHRSEDAYPMLLEEDEDLNLNLTAFVACSGATTDTLLNGGTGVGSWGEGSQLDPLSASTDIVTITIGGNDVGFGNAMLKCTLTNDMPSSWEYGQIEYDRFECASELEQSQSTINSPTFSSKIVGVLEAILSKLNGSAEVILVGYPNLFPEYASMNTVGCDWGFNSLGWGSTSGRSVSEEEVGLIRQTASFLNATLGAAVDEIDDSRLSYIDASSFFTDHEICGSSTAFLYHINSSVTNGSYHPNGTGQEAYKYIIRDKMTE